MAEYPPGTQVAYLRRVDGTIIPDPQRGVIVGSPSLGWLAVRNCELFAGTAVYTGQQERILFAGAGVCVGQQERIWEYDLMPWQWCDQSWLDRLLNDASSRRQA